MLDGDLNRSTLVCDACKLCSTEYLNNETKCKHCKPRNFNNKLNLRSRAKLSTSIRRKKLQRAYIKKSTTSGIGRFRYKSDQDDLSDSLYDGDRSTNLHNDTDDKQSVVNSVNLMELSLNSDPSPFTFNLNSTIQSHGKLAVSSRNFNSVSDISDSSSRTHTSDINFNQSQIQGQSFKQNAKTEGYDPNSTSSNRTQLNQYFVRYKRTDFCNDPNLHLQATDYILRKIDMWSDYNNFPVHTSHLINEVFKATENFNMLRYLLLKFNYYLFNELLNPNISTKFVMCELANLGFHIASKNESNYVYLLDAFSINRLQSNLISDSINIDRDQLQFLKLVKGLYQL